MKASVAIVALCLLCFVISVQAQLQTSSAAISGVVTDPAHGIVSNARISVRNLETGTTESRRSDSEGRYRFPRLAPGEYLLTAEGAGFGTTERRMLLTVGSDFDIPVELRIEGKREKIDVEGSAPTVDAARTQLSGTIQRAEIERLPLNGRNYLNLALLVPGVQRSNLVGNTQYATTSAVPGTGLSVSGQRNLSNSYLVDGLSANDDAAGLTGTFYGFETVREYQVVTSNAAAEFGRATAGSINVVTQSGTNTVHGTVYGYLKNQRFNAPNALSHNRLPLTQAQYGAGIAGPLMRNRTFLFVNFEETRGQATGLTVITPQNVAAINSALLRFDYGGAFAVTGQYPSRSRTDNLFARLDHRFGERDQMFLRYYFYDLATDNVQGAGGLSTVSRGSNLGTSDHSIALGNVLTLSPRAFLESRLHYFRSRLIAPPANTVGPAITISGVANLGPTNIFPTARNTDTGELLNNINVELGAHSIKAGADILYNHITIVSPGLLQGSYSFASLAAFTAGRYTQLSQDFGRPSVAQHNPNYGVFVQDEWRMRPGLTINAGLRYDVQLLRQSVRTDTNNVAPRIGLAWSPSESRKTVLRASFGIYYGRLPMRITALALQRNGLEFRSATLTPNQAGAPVFPTILNAFPANTAVSIQTIDRTIPVESSVQSSFEIERELATGLSLSAGYNHLRGLHIVTLHGINVPGCATGPNLCRPNPAFADIAEYAGLGDSWYDGLNVSLRARPARWGFGRLSYTWSKAIDTVGQAFQTTPTVQNNVGADRGASDNDQRHRLVVSGSLLTTPKSGDSLWGKLWRGFALSSIFSYGSPLPLNATTGTDANGDGYINDRPFGAGRNALRGFGNQSLDARLSRTFLVEERWKLEAMLEGFNVLNHANYLLPNTTFGTGSFPGNPRAGYGQATAVTDTRQLQIALRLNW